MLVGWRIAEEGKGEGEGRRAGRKGVRVGEGERASERGQCVRCQAQARLFTLACASGPWSSTRMAASPSAPRAASAASARDRTSSGNGVVTGEWRLGGAVDARRRCAGRVCDSVCVCGGGILSAASASATATRAPHGEVARALLALAQPRLCALAVCHGALALALHVSHAGGWGVAQFLASLAKSWWERRNALAGLTACGPARLASARASTCQRAACARACQHMSARARPCSTASMPSQQHRQHRAQSRGGAWKNEENE